MLINKSIKISFLVLSAILAGCATSRSEIKLAAPAASTVQAATGQVVVIRSVKDERVFEQEPGNPSTPSLGFEGANKASAELKLRAIARKRNGFGKALGDVMLEGNQTVESVVRDNLAASFEQAGYRVKSSGADYPSALIVDVRIKRFWAWMKPGFWSLTLSADIVTDLVLSGNVTPTTISVHAEDGRQLVTDSAWMEIIDAALTDYRAQALKKLPTAKNIAKN